MTDHRTETSLKFESTVTQTGSIFSGMAEGVKGFYHSDVFVVLLGLFILGYFIFAMLPNNERFRDWFNHSQVASEESAVRVFPVVLLMMLSPFLIGLFTVVFAIRLTGENGPGMGLVLIGATIVTFVGQRLYAIKIVP